VRVMRAFAESGSEGLANGSGHEPPRNQLKSRSEATRKEDLRGRLHALVGQTPARNMLELLTKYNATQSSAVDTPRAAGEAVPRDGAVKITRPAQESLQSSVVPLELRSQGRNIEPRLLTIGRCAEFPLQP